MSVGRIDVQKGYEYTVEVAKSVFAKHPDWSWDIWGLCDSLYTQKIQRIIERKLVYLIICIYMVLLPIFIRNIRLILLLHDFVLRMVSYGCY